jgi:hypothetical protein
MDLEKNIDEQITNLITAEKLIDTSTLHECKETLRVVIPFSIKLLKSSKKLIIASKRRF